MLLVEKDYNVFDFAMYYNHGSYHILDETEIEDFKEKDKHADETERQIDSNNLPHESNQDATNEPEPVDETKTDETEIVDEDDNGSFFGSMLKGMLYFNSVLVFEHFMLGAEEISTILNTRYLSTHVPLTGVHSCLPF